MMKEIENLEGQLQKAMEQSDIETLDKLISDDLIFTLPNGLLISKEDDLNNYRNNVQNISKMELLDLKILPMSKEIISTLTTCSLEGTFGDVDISGKYQYTRIWQKTNDQYKVTLGHVSFIS